MIQVIYNGVDITDNVSINQCRHDMYAEGRSDSLVIRFGDAADLWDRWSPQVSDTLDIVYGSIRTGTMYIYGTRPQNGLYEVSALSAPRSGYIKRSKAWSRVRLSQIAKEIAERHGLTLDNPGIDNHLYAYILQENESDFGFLHRRLILEGCAFLVYDGRLVVYNQSDMEHQDPVETVTIGMDGNYRFTDNSGELYGSCCIECGDYSGMFVADFSNDCTLTPPSNLTVGSDYEAARFACGLVREANKNAYTGYIKGQIMPQYAAASVINLENKRAPSWDGPVFLTHVRNEYATGTSKLFFRRPLKGY